MTDETWARLRYLKVGMEVVTLPSYETVCGLSLPTREHMVASKYTMCDPDTPALWGPPCPRCLAIAQELGGGV